MVHPIAQERREAAFANLRKYDVILSQPIKSFGVLNTDSLQTLNKPVITYPNIYFRGFHPDICFLGPGGKRIRTPLANNNSLIVLLAYLSGASEAECRDRFTPETYEAYGYGTVWDESREILRRREAALDIHVAQFFDHPENAPNLYVMNHPSMEILSHVGSEALRFMGRDPAPVRWDVMPDRLRTGDLAALPAGGRHARPPRPDAVQGRERQLPRSRGVHRRLLPSL